MVKRGPYTSSDVESALRRLRKAPERAGVSLMVHRSAAVLFRLDEGERAPLLAAAARLANTVPGLGPVQAFEVLASIGRAAARVDGQDAGE